MIYDIIAAIYWTIAGNLEAFKYWVGKILALAEEPLWTEGE